MVMFTVTYGTWGTGHTIHKWKTSCLTTLAFNSALLSSSAGIIFALYRESLFASEVCVWDQNRSLGHFSYNHTLPELAQISASFLPHRTILFCTGLLSSWNHRLLTFHQLSFSYRHCRCHHGSHCHSNIHGMVGSWGDGQGAKHEVWMVECDITITVIFVTVWRLLKQWSTDYSVWYEAQKVPTRSH